MIRLDPGARLPTVTAEAVQGFFGDYRYLSNYHLCPVLLAEDGLCYPSSEHAYVAQKTTSLAVRRVVASIAAPAEARRYGMGIPLRPDWAGHRTRAMLVALRAKFSQNPELGRLLLATGSQYLEETNDWDDTFWGVAGGYGMNMLGRTLMQVRDELRRAAGRAPDGQWLQ